MKLTWASALMVVAAVSSAQAQGNPPSGAASGKPEIVAVLITGASCCGEVAYLMRQGLDRLRTQLKRQAASEGVQVRVIGTLIDGSKAALKPYGAFDQVVEGGRISWHNPLLEELVWRDSIAQPTVPQVVVYRQAAGGGQKQLIKRFLGSAEIQGATLDSTPRR